MGEENKKSNKAYLLAAYVVVTILIIAGLYFFISSHKSQPPKKSLFPASIDRSQYTIVAYYPTNLPSGWGISGFKLLKKNVMYYNVTSPGGQVYNVTVQPLVSSFDFVSFKKKFIQPDEYNTPIGSNLVGFAGSSLVGSVQTTDNDWILLNAGPAASMQDMETITRSLHQASL